MDKNHHTDSWMASWCSCWTGTRLEGTWRTAGTAMVLSLAWCRVAGPGGRPWWSTADVSAASEACSSPRARHYYCCSCRLRRSHWSRTTTTVTTRCTETISQSISFLKQKQKYVVILQTKIIYLNILKGEIKYFSDT